MERGITFTYLGVITLFFPMITWQTFPIPLFFLIFGISFILYDKKQLEKYLSDYSPKSSSGNGGNNGNLS